MNNLTDRLLNLDNVSDELREKWRLAIRKCIDHQIDVSDSNIELVGDVGFHIEDAYLPSFTLRNNGIEHKFVLRFVGFSGKAGSGKDTCADIFEKLTEASPRSFGPRLIFRDAFANTLKEICAKLTDTPFDLFSTEEGKSRYNQFADMSNRKIAQLVGTECFRDVFNEDIWIMTVLNKAIALNELATMVSTPNDTNPIEIIVIVSDCRFENEANFIRALNGDLVMVQNLNHQKTSAGEEHRSEKLFPLKDGDIIIENDGVSLEALSDEISRAFHLD